MTRCCSYSTRPHPIHVMHSRRNATWGRLISHVAVESSCSCYQSLHTLLQPVHTNSIQKVVDSASVRAGNWGSCLLSLDSHHRRFCQTPPTSLPPAPSLPPPVLKLIPTNSDDGVDHVRECCSCWGCAISCLLNSSYNLSPILPSFETFPWIKNMCCNIMVRFLLRLY